MNIHPKCEPQLGQLGLYDMTGGGKDEQMYKMALLWTLNLSDGNNSLLDISIRSKLSFSSIKEAADALISRDLLELIERSD